MYGSMNYKEMFYKVISIFDGWKLKDKKWLGKVERT